ncbi:hypothetical protein Tco_1488654 [Tanacetum coccineum]
MKITHLCFVDDLLVLCHGDVNSDKVIKKALEYFSNVSVLYPNLSKSTIVCGSMDIITIDNILHILPFKRGKLHVRYLGKNKSMTYAGRAQLIAFVLVSIQVTIVKLKGRSVWEMEKHNNDSWMWKSLLELRSKVRKHMQYKVGNGCLVSMWHDQWSMLPPLDSILSRREIYAAGFSIEDYIPECIHDNN